MPERLSRVKTSQTYIIKPIPYSNHQINSSLTLTNIK